jgi:hypothetical protein
MNADEQKQLQEKVSESHAAIRTIIQDIDLEMRVYSDTDWRIRDILGHITTWARASTRSLRAFLDGTEYSIPGISDDETDFNEQAVLEQRELSVEEIVLEWEQSREDFISALRGTPLDQFPGDLLFPWGEDRGSIADLAEFIIEHDEEHRNEIVKALQTPKDR